MSCLVTIGMTAYNAEATVERAVMSALGQSWRPLEILVVDDASTDGTVSIVERLGAAHEEIRLVRQETNTGVGGARDRIVEEARGEFIVFFDDDDVSDPERIALQMRRITDYEREFAAGEPVVCHAARRQIMPDGSERIERTMGERDGAMAPHGPAVARRILAGAPLEDAYGACATCSQMARTKTYRDIGGFDPAFRRSEDTEFNVRLALAGGHFTGIADPLVTQTLTRTTDKSLRDELRYMLAVADKHADVYDNRAHYQFSRSWIETKYAWLANDWRRFVAGLVGSAFSHPLMTWQRIRLALPTLEANRAFARFHDTR